ncbi:MAG: GTP-binding protein, partial [Candidatus Lokiarchaeota archaeon]|nr:GTP-binding protein [Candidatus Lokiarchaeota archaeon]
MNNSTVIKSVILSIFDEEGPTPTVFWPENMEESARLLIAMKTISLLMGDTIYQNGEGIEGINYFGVLPFPDLRLNGLTYFFLIPDEKARGQAKASTITVLINEENKTFFHENMKYLRVIIDEAATKIQNADGELKVYEQTMEALREGLISFSKELKDPFSHRRKIKIIYAGLDRAGKTSFLLAIKKRYSEIVKTLPTKGVQRTEEKIFEEQNSQMTVWDLGGQKRYREKYIEQSKYYLYNVDLLFYLFDIQDPRERLDESLQLFEKIIASLKELDEFPPIIVCLNKNDPDVKDDFEIKEKIQYLTNKLKEKSDKFFVKIFKTSIFDYWSIISAYSYGLSRLSPNREFFKKHLKDFARKTDAEALLLLNENGIILSSFSMDEISGKVFEISAPHFQTLYKTFKEFKLLKKDLIVSSGITDEKKNVIFKK